MNHDNLQVFVRLRDSLPGRGVWAFRADCNCLAVSSYIRNPVVDFVSLASSGQLSKELRLLLFHGGK